MSLQTVEVPVVVSICPLVPALPRLSTKAALRVIVLLAVNVPLAVVFAATTRSPVRVVLPLTVRSLPKVVFSVTVSVESNVVAVAVTLKSVVMLVTSRACQ